jgi:hypothetical protein
MIACIKDRQYPPARPTQSFPVECYSSPSPGSSFIAAEFMQ